MYFKGVKARANKGDFLERCNSDDNINKTNFYLNFLVQLFKFYEMSYIRVLPKSKINAVTTI